MLRALLSSSLACALVFCATAAHAQEFRPEWFACEADSDCIVTVGYCGYDWAVNKAALAQVNEFVAQWKACEKTMTHNPHAIAKCEVGKCVVKITDGKGKILQPTPGELQ